MFSDNLFTYNLCILCFLKLERSDGSVFLLLLNGRPTAENLIPIRLDIEIDGQRYKDAFAWNPNGIGHLSMQDRYFYLHLFIKSNADK